MIQKTLPLILIFLIGYLLKQRRILAERDAMVLGKLVTNLVAPVVIIRSLATSSMELRLMYIPLVALIVVASLALLGFFLAAVLRLENKTRGAFITAFPTLEIGTIGFAFMLSVFGEVGLRAIVLFDVANMIFLFTAVNFIAGNLGDGSGGKIAGVERIVKNPLIWAIVIGLLLNIVSFQNLLLSNLLDTIGNSLLLLMMLMLGLRFQFERSSLRLSSAAVLLKTLLGLLLGWGISFAFGLGGVERIAVIVGASLPPSMFTLVYSDENHLDTRYVTNMLSLALPFGLVFLTIIANFLH